MKSPDHLTIIESRPSGLLAYLRHVWSYRSVTFALAGRDIKVRYSQTFLGILWAVIQPLTGLVIFTIFFGRLIKLEVPGLPYSLFAFSGMVSWFFFSHIVYNAGVSLVESQDLIRKVYFPKILLLFAKTCVGLVEFSISLVLLIGLMALLGHPTTRAVFFCPCSCC